MALLTGHALSWWQQVARESGALRPWYIHLTLPREALHRRLAARVDAMLAAGFVEEVRGLLASGVRPDAAGLDGVGYREVVSLLQGRLPETTLRDAILVSTRRYAKRQETWFRNQLRREQGARSSEPEVWMLDATILRDRLLRDGIALPFFLPPSPFPVYENRHHLLPDLRRLRRGRDRARARARPPRPRRALRLVREPLPPPWLCRAGDVP